MGFMDEKLWTILEHKAEDSDRDLNREQQISNEYITGIKSICAFGVERAKTIRDTFPMFTLHDETHICNVMQLMVKLLGQAADDLTRDETAMLILAACCHDIGMSYSDADKDELFEDVDRLNKYLDNNKGEYIKAYANGGDKPNMTENMIQNYLRTIHHERVMELLYSLEWPSILEGKIDRQDLIRVCQSHGRDICVLDGMEKTTTIDLRFCAILLRLSDILDFDTSRAPRVVYEYCGFEEKHSLSSIRSKEEWDKHISSHGFEFNSIADRSYPYNLSYCATSKSMQVEQALNAYLDWIDEELSGCNKQIKRFTGKWQNIVLPIKIKRNIKAEGYVTGQYRLTLDQSQIMELLVGKELYSDPSVFVRELIQNAIDAVRTREQLDKNLPSDWKAQINIRCWMDEEGYHWFRIEDNGIGMTENIIMNFFLKIGCSYYCSDTFLQAKLRCKSDPNYMPISRFGIGILSCFMGDEGTNRVEVSTKHFNEPGIYYPALRLTMNGMSGYYYMSNKEFGHNPGPMKGISAKEKEQYLKQAGTVIAVRTNLYQSGKYRGFKEIVDKYVVYPPVAIHYDGIEGSFDYPTELEFMDAMHKIAPNEDKEKNGIIEIPLSQEQLNSLYTERPELSFIEPPKILINCISLDRLTKSPYLSGAILVTKTVGEHEKIKICFGNQTRNLNVIVTAKIDEDKIYLDIHLSFSSLLEESIQKNQLDVAIREMQNEFNEIFSVDFLKQKDAFTIDTYKDIEKKWSFFVCDLCEFDWYIKYFKNTRTNTGLNSITAHNGIFCGNGYFLSQPRGNDKALGTILLLKDKYRPIVDVTRDGIRMLTLEALSDMELIKKNIAFQRFDVSCDMSKLDEANFSYIPMSKYLKLLNARPDLEEQLVFMAGNALCAFEELQRKIQKREKVNLNQLYLLSNRSTCSSERNKSLYKYLCVAYLRSKFSLRVSMNRYSSEVYIVNKENDIPKDYIDIFPAAFFLVPLEKDCPYLTTKSVYIRCACNANHPLSHFVLHNCLKLKNHVPGILKEILRSLAEDEESDIINNINEMLKHLRNLPSNPIQVPSTLILTEKDFA